MTSRMIDFIQTIRNKTIKIQVLQQSSNLSLFTLFKKILTLDRYNYHYMVGIFTTVSIWDRSLQYKLYEEKKFFFGSIDTSKCSIILKLSSCNNLLGTCNPGM